MRACLEAVSVSDIERAASPCSWQVPRGHGVRGGRPALRTAPYSPRAKTSNVQSPKREFTGKSGYDHLFDFVIPKSKKQPERILQAINRSSRDEAMITAFAWFDTREVRPPNSRAYAILNDSEREVPTTVVDALQSYDVRVIPWSKRRDVVAEMTT